MKKCIAFIGVLAIICSSFCLAESAGNPVSSVIDYKVYTDGEYLYADNLKISMANQTVERLENTGKYMTYSNGMLYFVKNGCLWEMMTDGSECFPIVDDEGTGPWNFEGVQALCIDDGWVYYTFGTINSSSEVRRSINKLRIDGGEFTRLTDLGISEYGIDQMVIAGDWIYFCDFSSYNKGIYRVKKDGSGFEKIYDRTPLCFAVAEDTIFGSFKQERIEDDMLNFNFDIIRINIGSGSAEIIGLANWNSIIYVLEDRLYYDTPYGIRSVDFYGEEPRLVCPTDFHYCPVGDWVFSMGSSTEYIFLDSLDGAKRYRVVKGWDSYDLEEVEQ